jgi:peptidoglycan L-alanyl-D-glutamate endopeptidase CwlK
MPILGKRSLETLHGVHPDLVKLMHEAIKETPVDFTITDGGRTTEQQKALYAKGRTKPGGKVTNADGVIKKSNHQAKKDGYFHAVDLYPYIYGKVDYNDEHDKLPIIAAHIMGVARKLGIKIGWGGLWKGSWDKPHFELL